MRMRESLEERNTIDSTWCVSEHFATLGGAYPARLVLAFFFRITCLSLTHNVQVNGPIYL